MPWYLLLLIPAVACAALAYRKYSARLARMAYQPYYRWMRGTHRHKPAGGTHV